MTVYCASQASTRRPRRQKLNSIASFVRQARTQTGLQRLQVPRACNVRGEPIQRLSAHIRCPCVSSVRRASTRPIRARTLSAHARIVGQAHTPSLGVFGALLSALSAGLARTHHRRAQTTKRRVNCARQVDILNLQVVLRCRTASYARRANIPPTWAPHQ